MSEADRALNPNDLTFSDKDIVTLWGDPHRANISIDTVEFREVDPVDKTDIADLDWDFAKYTWAKYARFSDISARKAVKIPGDKDWWWHAWTVPRPETMNAISATLLQSFGAHDLPLVLLRPDTTDKEGNARHKASTIGRAIISGFVPVSTDPESFIHDMSDHSLGICALNKSTMSVIVSVFQLAAELEGESPETARKLNILLVHAFDYYTYDENFEDKQRKSVRKDAFLSLFLEYVARNLPENIAHTVRYIIRQKGFRIDKSNVERSDDTVDYYRELDKVLSAN